jgi:subtilisin family serine protease
VGAAAVAVLAAAGGLLAGAPPAVAQRPDVSPRLPPLLRRDAAHPVWLFVRPGVPLDSVTDLVIRNGGTVRRRSRWLHAVSAVLPAGAMEAARTSRLVARLQPVTRFRGPPRPAPAPRAPFPVPAIVAGPAQDSGYGPSAMPFSRLNVFPLARRGVRGAGTRIAVFDTGFETGLSPFALTTVEAQYDFVFNDSIVRNEPADDPNASFHGTTVWSLLAAQVPDTMVGLAPDATYLLAKTEDIRSETTLEEDNFVAALEWADSLSADIVAASLGYLTFDGGSGYSAGDLNGDIAVTTVASDMAAERGIVVLAAVGNGGVGGLTTPADGDSVLGIGAEDSLGTVAGFSSRGPTADGRIKPDFSAPGVSVWVATPSGGGGVGYGRVNGTSYSTPIVAGVAALFLELHPTYAPMAVREALLRAADNRGTPNNARGYGRPDAHAAAVFPAGVVLVSPGAPVNAVTPTFTWTAPDIPAFALPISYRLTVTRTPGAITLLDTTLADTTVTLAGALHSGVPIQWQLTARSADSALALAVGDSAGTIPPWVTLEAFDDPDGVATRELRPEFRWRSPAVASPPGPFLYDVAIVRADNGQVDVLAESLSEPRFVPAVDLERNTPYRWRVTARLGSEVETINSRGTFVITDFSVPAVTQLFQNFPNPFPNPGTGLTTTCLWFDLSVEGVVGLSILDMRGHLVRRLVPAPDQGLFFRPGRYGRPESGLGRCDPRFEWNGTATNGELVPAGIYLAKLDTPAGTFFRRIVFLGNR